MKRVFIAALLFGPVLYLLAPGLILVEIDPSVTRPQNRPWNTLIEEIYPRAVVVSAHGFDFFDHWYLISTEGHLMAIESVLFTLRAEHPNRRIVVIACNPGGYVIDCPNVPYAMTNVWIIPDVVVGPIEAIARELELGDAVGAMDEFVHNP